MYVSWHGFVSLIPLTWLLQLVARAATSVPCFSPASHCTHGAAGFECLTEDVDEVLGLFNEVIQEPALQPDKTAFYKAQVTPVLN